MAQTLRRPTALLVALVAAATTLTLPATASGDHDYRRCGYMTYTTSAGDSYRAYVSKMDMSCWRAKRVMRRFYNRMYQDGCRTASCSELSPRYWRCRSYPKYIWIKTGNFADCKRGERIATVYNPNYQGYD